MSKKNTNIEVMVEDQEIKQGDDTITISKVSIVKKDG